jgi:hypothetical protein
MAEREKHPQTKFRDTGYYDFNLLSRLDIQPIDEWSFDAFVHDAMKTGVTLHDLQVKRVNSSTDTYFQKIWTLFGRGKNQSLDAWHLRTAHEHGLDGILTMDYKLERTFRQTQAALNAAAFSARVWTPSEFAKELGIQKVSPNLFCYTDASYPVRPDLHMPNVRRRPKDKVG